MKATGKEVRDCNDEWGIVLQAIPYCTSDETLKPLKNFNPFIFGWLERMKVFLVPMKRSVGFVQWNVMGCLFVIAASLSNSNVNLDFRRLSQDCLRVMQWFVEKLIGNWWGDVSSGKKILQFALVSSIMVLLHRQLSYGKEIRHVMCNDHVPCTLLIDHRGYLP